MVVELVVAELVEASKYRNDRRKGLTKVVVSTSSTTEESWKCFVLSKRLKTRSAVVEPVVAEPVEASKPPPRLWFADGHNTAFKVSQTLFWYCSFDRREHLQGYSLAGDG